MSRRGRNQTQSTSTEDPELSDAVINGIRFGINNVKKFVHETLPKCLTDETKHATSKRMEELTLRLIKAEMTYLQATGIVTEVVEEMPDDVDADSTEILKTCDAIADVSMDRIRAYENSLTERDLKQHATYTRLMQDMQAQLVVETAGEEEGSDAEENDEEEAEGDTSIIQTDDDMIPIEDPVTKQPLKDPVRNKTCGHIYGKTSITQLIKRNSKTRCPIAGCSNKSFLKPSHFAVDRKLTARIKQKQAEANKQKRR